MLTVTADAARAIRRLTDEHNAGGLRISSVANSAGDGSVSLSVISFEGRSQRQVATELGVSQIQVSWTMTKVLAKLRRSLGAPIPIPDPG